MKGSFHIEFIYRVLRGCSRSGHKSYVSEGSHHKDRVGVGLRGLGNVLSEECLGFFVCVASGASK